MPAMLLILMPMSTTLVSLPVLLASTLTMQLLLVMHVPLDATTAPAQPSVLNAMLDITSNKTMPATHPAPLAILSTVQPRLVTHAQQTAQSAAPQQLALPALVSIS